ncbi:hypothetical protein [Nocardioides sp. CER19]|uniref:hypothetical protein n=1 Tax=Nocardioides sp. CER19 TaxID=3038538 RepID=UPI00244C2D49|nr:hypothetical protein [Nocardioides sp. CER19]MDH2416315.1 hypothetical protein [Nocardioides sp. CER19]
MQLIWKTRSRRDRGAVAIVVAITSVLLFASAALTVDLGNTWSHKRAVQKQVDISAISAGIGLPASTTGDAKHQPATIASAVATYLTKSYNRVNGSPTTVTGAQLLDGNPANGEITWLTDSQAACDPATATATALCTTMRVLSPPADVDFGFAAIMGFHHTTVQRTATVTVVSISPGMDDTLPFWLPQGCGFGAAEADTSGGPASSTPATPTPTTGPPDPAGAHTLTGSNYSVTQGGKIVVHNLLISGIDTSKTDRATIRIYAPDYSRFVDYAAQDKQLLTNPLNVPDFTVSTELTSTPGVWHAYAYIEPKGNGTPTISSTSLTVTVTGTAGPSPTDSPTVSPTASPSSVPVGCVGQNRGNFGQLTSPRKDESNLQKAFSLNIAYGLDHLIQPYCETSGNSCPPEPNKDCGKADGDIPGGLVDNQSKNGRNCIEGDTGNDGPKTFDGLFGGGNVTKGRLDASNGTTRCPNGRHSERTNLTVNGTSINNDVLSCYLTGTNTLDSIAQLNGVDPSMLDQSVVDSPRFAWLPVVYANDRAQKNFQPIKEFVPAFITDETQTSYSSTSMNGTEINGSSVKVLRVFVFNKDALNPDVQHNSVKFDPNLGQPAVRLVG